MRKLPKKRFLETASYILRNQLAKETIYPFYCSVKLTRRCNFTCSFCNCWHVKNRWQDMPTEDVKRILDNIAQSPVMVCSFEGGDPLVRDDIEELLKYQYEKPWYLLFTTSERDLQNRYPMADYCKYIDFLHISIDEGHQNLEMFDELEEYTRWGSIVTIQIVVTKNDIDALEWKIKRCYDAGVKAVVMVAVQLKNTRDHLPDFAAISPVGLQLKRKYPGVIVSPDAYFDRLLWDHGCDASSIIVDADGYLYYPCRVLEEKTINLKHDSLMEYLQSADAVERRRRMAACDIRCGWYQYYATQSFVSPSEIASAWMPYFRDILNGGRQPVTPVKTVSRGTTSVRAHTDMMRESAASQSASPPQETEGNLAEIQFFEPRERG